MAYVGEKKRQYQLEWMQRRRQDWIDKHGPCAECRSWDSPEVDHIDPTTKLLNPARLWSLALDNPVRVAELAKCQVLCHDCHPTKTALENSVLPTHH